jgi:mono/diheme cytochrome c family protein
MAVITRRLARLPFAALHARRAWVRFAGACWLLAAMRLAAATKPATTVDFNAQIRPLLSAHCFSCHGPDEGSRKADLRLDLRDRATAPRKGHAAIQPGDPGASEVIRRVTSTDPAVVMPPPKHGPALNPEEVETLRLWIASGAEYAVHWSFVKPQRPQPPAVSAPGWPQNPVDNFVLAKLAAAGLKSSPPADARTLARRLSLDLIGLPPTIAEVETFARAHTADPRTAVAGYVDRLLASPHFGEHWARPWLDLARFADSAGHGSDPLRPNVWPYRDWLIAALNRNQPFDQFTLEQIAGDLLPNASEEQRIATAFHRNTMTNTEGGTDDEEWRVAAVKDRLNVTLQAWMGLTMSCASCHTHKFDPISHREYYQMFALFNQTEDNDQPDERPTLPLLSAAQRQQQAEISAKLAATEAELKAPGAERRKELATTQGPPRELFEIGQLRRELAGIKATPLPVMRELPPGKQRQSRLLNKGNYLDPGEEVSPAVLAAFHPLPPTAPTNRLGLARWLVSPDNPLTARVVANRLWAQLFGAGLVETEEDFGTQGSLPSHPELLDWLACELQQPAQGVPWDLKRMLKLVVSSAAYQQSSRATPELLAQDPRNRLLSRYPRRRLEAEAVRDQALALSGLLSAKLGGPSVFPPQPDGLWRAAFNGERNYTTSTGEDRYRRGLYTFWRRTVPYPSMATFDAPSRENCAFRRLPSNTPLQAYVTLNDPVFVECAQALGRRLLQEGGTSPPDRAAFGLRLCLLREPDPEQVAALVKLYESELSAYRTREKEARRLATEPLGPLPDGVPVSEAAAWTVLANVLLNLDGVLTKN